MGQLTAIKFLRAWRRYTPGDVTEWPAGAAGVLVRRGIAEEIVDTHGARASVEMMTDNPKCERRGPKRCR